MYGIVIFEGIILYVFNFFYLKIYLFPIDLCDGVQIWEVTHRPLLIYLDALDKPNFNRARSSIFYNNLQILPIKDPVMFLYFGVCISVELILFAFANDFIQDRKIAAILQKLKTLEDEMSMLKRRELKTLEEVSILKQTLNSCQSGWNEFSKPNLSEYNHSKCSHQHIYK